MFTLPTPFGHLAEIRITWFYKKSVDQTFREYRMLQRSSQQNYRIGFCNQVEQFLRKHRFFPLLHDFVPDGKTTVKIHGSLNRYTRNEDGTITLDTSGAGKLAAIKELEAEFSKRENAIDGCCLETGLTNLHVGCWSKRINEGNMLVIPADVLKEIYESEETAKFLEQWHIALLDNVNAIGRRYREKIRREGDLQLGFRMIGDSFHIHWEQLHGTDGRVYGYKSSKSIFSTIEEVEKKATLIANSRASKGEVIDQVQPGETTYYMFFLEERIFIVTGRTLFGRDKGYYEPRKHSLVAVNQTMPKDVLDDAIEIEKQRARLVEARRSARSEAEKQDARLRSETANKTAKVRSDVEVSKERIRSTAELAAFKLEQMKEIAAIRDKGLSDVDDLPVSEETKEDLRTEIHATYERNLGAVGRE